jgi:hypothetical protein
MDPGLFTPLVYRSGLDPKHKLKIFKIFKKNYFPGAESGPAVAEQQGAGAAQNGPDRGQGNPRLVREQTLRYYHH